MCEKGKNFLLSDGICLCRKGYFLNIDLKICEPCDLACMECIGPTENECIKCNPKMFLLTQPIKVDGKKVCLCKLYFGRQPLSPKCDYCG
jgi:hypothetical protein